MNLVLKKEKYILGRIGLNFWGFGEQLNKFWGFGEHKQNTFRELRPKLSGIWGDQSIIFRELGSKNPPWGASLFTAVKCAVICQGELPCCKMCRRRVVGRLVKGATSARKICRFSIIRKRAAYISQKPNMLAKPSGFSSSHVDD